MDENTVLLAQDETHVRSYQALRATWSPKGEQKQIPTYGHHVQVTLFGTVDMHTGDVFCTTADSCNAASFLEFLKKVMKRYANKRVIMIIDNARIHHAKLLRPFLKEHHQRLYLLFLPPYSPNLNPIEKLWRWLKDGVISNVFHKNQSEIEQAVERFLDFTQSCPERVLHRIGC
jgi:transposase